MVSPNSDLSVASEVTQAREKGEKRKGMFGRRNLLTETGEWIIYRNPGKKKEKRKSYGDDCSVLSATPPKPIAGKKRRERKKVPRPSKK